MLGCGFRKNGWFLLVLNEILQQSCYQPLISIKLNRIPGGFTRFFTQAPFNAPPEYDVGYDA
jgi:hypothetical protein